MEYQESIRNGGELKSSAELGLTFFVLEESDFDKALSIYKKFNKNKAYENLLSLKEDYLKFDTSIAEECNQLFEKYGYKVNPFNFVGIVRSNLMKRLKREMQEEAENSVSELFFHAEDYQNMRAVSVQVGELVSFWIDRKNYFEKKEEMEKLNLQLTTWYKKGRQLLPPLINSAEPATCVKTQD